MSSGMRIQGIGIVFSRGRGMAALEQALEEGWTAPDASAFRVDLAAVGDRALFRRMRRADRFSRLASLAARDAVQDGNAVFDDRRRVGIILASAFGPQVTTFKFLDNIIQYGDVGVSPTLFSHSVHNAAASYIAKILDVRGPTQTLTQFHFSMHQAFGLARMWLDEQRCRYVLVGAADECGEAMEYICSRMLNITRDGRIRPFAFSKSPVAVPGEGSVFFLVTNQGDAGGYCRVAVTPFGSETGDRGDADLILVDADGMAGDESHYLESMSPDIPAAGFSPLFGSMMTGSAFSCASAALMLRNQVLHASPVPDNPHGIRISSSHRAASLDRIHCIRYDCSGRRAMIEVLRE